MIRAVHGRAQARSRSAVHRTSRPCKTRPIRSPRPETTTTGTRESDKPGQPVPPNSLRLNARLLTAERLLTQPDGLPRRPYYKHMLYAPGLYTGYGPKTVSGIRESIELKDYTLAEKEVP